MCVTTWSEMRSHPPATARTPASSAAHASSVLTPPSTRNQRSPGARTRYACTERGRKGIGVVMRHTSSATGEAGSAVIVGELGVRKSERAQGKAPREGRGGEKESPE